MSKKRIIYTVIGIAVAVLGCVILVLYNFNQPREIKAFSLSDYQWEIKNFSSDETVGRVDDANVAIEKSKELWNDKFGSNGEKPYAKAKLGDFTVSYDSQEECWHVTHTVSKNTLGGAAHAVIQKNWQVLAVWQDD